MMVGFFNWIGFVAPAFPASSARAASYTRPRVSWLTKNAELRVKPPRSGSPWRASGGWATFGTMEPDVDLPLDAYLKVMKKDGETFRFPIRKKTVTIGRDPACDLHLDDPYVSRKHCQIVFRGEHFTVIDLQSLNKTVVKGKQYIQKNLVPGNVIDLGATKLMFEWPTHLEWRRAHGIVDEVPTEADIPEKAEPEKPENE